MTRMTGMNRPIGNILLKFTLGSEAWENKTKEMKASTESFQALWIEISFVKKKNVICGVLYRQHNSPESFLKYLEETIDKFTSTGKNLCLLGDLIYVYKKSKPVITIATYYWLFKVVISFQLFTNQHVFTTILQA